MNDIEQDALDMEATAAEPPPTDIGHVRMRDVVSAQEVLDHWPDGPDDAADGHALAAGRVTRFLARFSGTQWEHVVSPSSARRQAVLGALLLVSTLLSIATVAVALSQLGFDVGGVFAASAGYACAIGALQFAIVSEPTPRRVVSRLLVAAPRVVIALFVGFVLSSALTAALFSADVERTIDVARRASAAQEAHEVVETATPDGADADLELVRDQRAAELESRRDELAYWQTQFDVEFTEGTGGRPAGLGPIAQSIMENATRAEQEVTAAQMRLTQAEDALARAADARASELRRALDEGEEARQEVLAQGTTFTDRLAALADVGNSSVTATRYLLMLMLILIDLLPLAFKLSGPSSHDLLISEGERIAKDEALARAALESEVRRSWEVLDRYRGTVGVGRDGGGG